MKTRDTVTGDELSVAEAVEVAKRSVVELELQLAKAKAFVAEAKAGTLREGQTFLSFDSVVENGYDRTGPNEVVVEAD